MSRTTAESVICTVDVVVLTLRDDALHVVLHTREREPFKGMPALPGGYVRPQEDTSAWHAAARVLRDRSGIDSPYLEQLATWSGADRDPRGWSVSIVYCALVPFEQLPLPRVGLTLAPVRRLPRLAFDHRDIIELAVERVGSKSQYSSLPVYLCSEPFSLPQLQSVYEAAIGEPINKVSFRRKIDELGMLEPVAGAMQGGAHRPAQLYQLKPQFRRTLSTMGRGLNARGA
jgi:8-oxo-dGTP diphosphatase